MVRHFAPELDPEPRLYLDLPAERAFSEVAAIAAEVLLAGHVQTSGPIVDAVRAAVSTVIGTGSARTRLEIELSRDKDALTVSFLGPRARDRTIRHALRAFADELSSSGTRLDLTWKLPHM